MESILPVTTVITTNKKHQLKNKIKQIKGFIVNIHDSLNFDIDFTFTAEQQNNYNDVIINNYVYQDYACEDTTEMKTFTLQPKIGITYRCRLKGIYFNQKTPVDNYIYIEQNEKISELVTNMINHADGWVTCNVSDIDVYQRLLVDVFINIGNFKNVKDSKSINLKDFILKTSSDAGFLIFSTQKTF
jgi:hypothetical protein